MHSCYGRVNRSTKIYGEINSKSPDPWGHQQAWSWWCYIFCLLAKIEGSYLPSGDVLVTTHKMTFVNTKSMEWVGKLLLLKWSYFSCEPLPASENAASSTCTMPTLCDNHALCTSVSLPSYITDMLLRSRVKLNVLILEWKWFDIILYVS